MKTTINSKKDYWEISIKKHKEYKWKLAVQSKVPLNNKDDLSIYYTPWVAAPCLEIQKEPELAYDYTRKNNTVAVISDGSAVLWLGNIGWLAGLPVMEWKAILFKSFADIDAIPIVLSTQDPDEIINIVEKISPTFGWINLEDIKAPNCFYIEDELKKRLQIPVCHDDQHGTAIVVLAGIINALKLTNKKIEETKIIITGAGAAWTACAKILKNYWAKNIITFDSKWAIYTNRDNLTTHKQELATFNIQNEKRELKEAIQDADIFIGVSMPNLITSEEVKKMNTNPIIFALSNPNPEITPEEAKKWWAYIIATWRSDFPNQINNVLAFPWLFRWLLDSKSKQISDDHKIAAAKAIANFIKSPSPEKIIPSPLTKWVAKAVSKAVQKVNNNKI